MLLVFLWHNRFQMRWKHFNLILLNWGSLILFAESSNLTFVSGKRIFFFNLLSTWLVYRKHSIKIFPLVIFVFDETFSRGKIQNCKEIKDFTCLKNDFRSVWVKNFIQTWNYMVDPELRYSKINERSNEYFILINLN